MKIFASLAITDNQISNEEYQTLRYAIEQQIDQSSKGKHTHSITINIDSTYEGDLCMHR